MCVGVTLFELLSVSFNCHKTRFFLLILCCKSMHFHHTASLRMKVLLLLYNVTSSSAMAERPRDESAILRGWVTLRLNFRLKGYVSRQYLIYLWTVR